MVPWLFSPIPHLYHLSSLVTVCILFLGSTLLEVCTFVIFHIIPNYNYPDLSLYWPLVVAVCIQFSSLGPLTVWKYTWIHVDLYIIIPILSIVLATKTFITQVNDTFYEMFWYCVWFGFKCLHFDSHLWYKKYIFVFFYLIPQVCSQYSLDSIRPGLTMPLKNLFLWLFLFNTVNRC